MELQDKRVTVVGLARSGLAAARLLLDKGAKVSITDCNEQPKIRQNIDKIKNRKNIEQLEIGRHTEDLIKGRDLIVVSPGVAAGALPIVWAKEKGIPVIGEMELAFAFCPAAIIAITGTNGKTTVSTLVGQILENAGRKCVVCGNIGTPFSGEVLSLSNEHLVVLEVSSFQLESIDKFRPKVAVILNLTSDHLDRHANFQEYFQAKSRIFANQTKEDWAVLNAQDPYGPSFAARTKAKVLYFSKDLVGGKNNSLNANQLAALTISSIFKVPEKIAINTAGGFKGIEHRLEEVAQIGQVVFINDSKATNVDSTLWALDVIERPIVLIAGGRDKGSDFSAVKEKMAQKVRAMILLGEAKERIARAFAGVGKTQLADSLSQAVKDAYDFARPGDCVLLSPMCASFDMFADYAERGKVFKEAVKDLAYSLQLKA